MTIGDKLGRKLFMQIGVFTQCIMLVLMATFSYIDWVNSLFYVMLVVYFIAFSIGMEACGIIYTCELLPQCAWSHAMYSQWVAGCLICFGNYLELKTNNQVVYYVFGGCCLFAFLFMGLLFRETKGKEQKEVEDSFKNKVNCALLA